MLARPLALLRSDRRVQAAAGVAVLAGAAFAWWTISPLFLTTTVSEQTREATVTIASPAAPAAPTAGGPSPGAPASPAAPAATLLGRGELQRIDDLHKGSGPVVLFELEGKHFVRFEEVAIQNGPDLHVYLARGMGGAYDGEKDLYLGALKATNGTFAYELPAGTRVEDYKSVVVWCRAFAVLFTWADLQKD